ncbi:hypothetical protein [Kiloniella litopenaei]|nr:hypothetical protein [Kiloniella litopenaei]
MFTLGTQESNLSGAIEIKNFKGLFDGQNPFVDLHLDFPASFETYKMGGTTYMKAVEELGAEAIGNLSYRLSMLNLLYSKQRDLQRLITQYKRGNIKSFKKICNDFEIPEITLKSEKKEDVLAALYSVTSIMSSPITIHAQNEELSKKIPLILQDLYEKYNKNTTNFVNKIIENQFLENLHHDCLDLYPNIVSLDLPIRPTLYYDYINSSEHSKVPARVSTSDFGTCSNFYKDLAEVFSRQLVLLAGLNNLHNRGDHDLFDDKVRLNKKGKIIKEFSSLNSYANVDLGKKLGAIDNPFYQIDKQAIDNNLRNSIAHYKYDYDEASQQIAYYPKKEGMQRNIEHSLYFIQFMRKTLLLFREVHNLNHVIKSLLYFKIFILRKE